jgi:hypothetical protein
MSDNINDADHTPDEAIYAYDYRVDAAEHAVTADCTTCGGKGEVTLLTTGGSAGSGALPGQRGLCWVNAAHLTSLSSVRR